ncbi:hypothetical protein SAMN04487981_12148 [Streptomyces sp. cf386]|nr:hypothetical protein SAMN04487981_12148 [Streptomyces sp. cf386]
MTQVTRPIGRGRRMAAGLFVASLVLTAAAPALLALWLLP